MPKGIKSSILRLHCKTCDKILLANNKSGYCREHKDCSGVNNNFYGRKHNKETLVHLSKVRTGTTHVPYLVVAENLKRINTGRKNTTEQIQNIKDGIAKESIESKENRISLSSEFMTNWWSNPENHAKMTEIRKHQNTPEVIAKIAKQLDKREPTDIERRTTKIISDYKLPYKYVGSGDDKCYIAGRRPDFIDIIGKKKLIEVYYEYYKIREYGSEEAYKAKRYELFSKYGYDTLFLNYKEMRKMPDEEISDIIMYHTNG